MIDFEPVVVRADLSRYPCFLAEFGGCRKIIKAVGERDRAEKEVGASLLYMLLLVSIGKREIGRT